MGTVRVKKTRQNRARSSAFFLGSLASRLGFCAALMAQCRQEDPDIAVLFSEVPLSQQIKGLHEDLYDVGFSQSAAILRFAAGKKIPTSFRRPGFLMRSFRKNRWLRG